MEQTDIGDIKLINHRVFNGQMRIKEMFISLGDVYSERMFI